MGKKFIKVSDVETANFLTKLGSQLIDKTSGIYKFLNNTKTKFSNVIIYTEYDIDKRSGHTKSLTTTLLQ